MILSHRSRRVSNLRKKSPDGHCLTGAFLYWNQWAGLFGHKGIESLGFRGHLTLDFPPVQAQFLAMRGMAKITNVVEIVKTRLNPNLNIGGIVITQFDKRKTLNKSVAELINESFCDKVFKTVIRDNVALAEAPIKGLNIFEYNKNSNGAKDYMELAKEVLKLK